MSEQKTIPNLRERIEEILNFHIEAIGATYGKDSLQPIKDTIINQILQVFDEEKDIKNLYKAYPTGLENITDKELNAMAISFDTPFMQHLVIAEELKRRRFALPKYEKG